jgi:hypothetical protein
VGRITTNGANSPLISVGSATSQTGILTASSALWRPELRFFVNINGTTPGTEHDKLLVNGNININGAQLVGTAGAGLAVGEQVAIIETVGGTITGTFGGLPSGSEVILSGVRFRVIYTATTVILRRI